MTSHCNCELCVVCCCSAERGARHQPAPGAAEAAAGRPGGHRVQRVPAPNGAGDEGGRPGVGPLQVLPRPPAPDRAHAGDQQPLHRNGQYAVGSSS